MVRTIPFFPKIIVYALALYFYYIILTKYGTLTYVALKTAAKLTKYTERNAFCCSISIIQASCIFYVSTSE